MAEPLSLFNSSAHVDYEQGWNSFRDCGQLFIGAVDVLNMTEKDLVNGVGLCVTFLPQLIGIKPILLGTWFGGSRIRMNEIPDFEDAVASFKHFLTEQGQPSKILWVFREDIWKQSPTDVVLRIPSQIKNLALAKKIFAEGRKKGLVDVQAIASVDYKVATTVWFPKFSAEELQGWNRGMKLSIAEPLPRAKSVGRLRWLCFRLQPNFRHYQRSELSVGTKAWAACSNAERL
jgi:hypothetical protein